jgi:anaerobic selenocysteine-containing dehydrogenase
MCGPGAGCGIYAFVKNGRLSRVAGMSEAPRNRGGVCPKSLASAEWLHSPDRLRVPLLRIGARGEGRFTPISWDEAVGRIADKLLEQKEKYGPESLAVLSPAWRTYSQLMQRFLIVHGSPNYGHSGICAMQKSFIFCYTLGSQPTCDSTNSDLIIYWGRQPIYSGPATGTARTLVAAKKRHARIIAVKPSMEPDAGMADLWLPLRPGTDAALALSMLHVVVGEDLIDKPFVDKWCYGFEQLKEHVRQFPPEMGRADQRRSGGADPPRPPVCTRHDKGRGDRCGQRRRARAVGRRRGPDNRHP